MNLIDIAKTGLNKLKEGKIGINIHAISKNDAIFLKTYFRGRGYDSVIDKLKLDNQNQIIYSVNIFNRLILEGVQNA